MTKTTCNIKRENLNYKLRLKCTKRYYLTEAIFPFSLAVFCGSLTFSAFRAGFDFVFIGAGILTIFPLAWFVLRFGRYLFCFYYARKCADKMKNDGKLKGVLLFEGGNRTGKSLNGHATAYYKSYALEQYINRWTLVLRSIKGDRKLSASDFLEFEEINEAFVFFDKHRDLIPALVTNVRVDDCVGRSSMELLGGHLLELNKLPRPCAVVLDESRMKVDNNSFKDIDGAAELIGFIRLFNQKIGDQALFIFIEQNSARAFLGYRDSLQACKHMNGVRVLLEPKRLLKRLETLYKKVDKCKDKDKPVPLDLAQTIYNLNKRIKKIGVLQLQFGLQGNKETENAKDRGDAVEYLPCDLPFDYDNRWFRAGYACKNDEITLSRFKGTLQTVEMLEDNIRLNESGKLAYRGELVAGAVKKKREQIKRKIKNDKEVA